MGDGGGVTILSWTASPPGHHGPLPGLLQSLLALYSASGISFHGSILCSFSHLTNMHAKSQARCLEYFKKQTGKINIQMFANSEMSYNGSGCQGGSMDSFSFWEGDKGRLPMGGHI